jgi:hypothetical protein
MNEHAEIRGGCLCGGTRYFSREKPRARSDCHCLDCRRSAGAPHVVWGVVNRTAFAIEQGEIRWVDHAERVRGFGSCCGTHLAMADSRDSADIEITVASLDDPTPFPPEIIIWTDDKLPWVVLDSTLPSFSRDASPHR